MSTRWEGKTPVEDCDWCDSEVTEPVRDEQAVAWIGDGASTYCSRACMEAHTEHRINAAGNEPS